MNSERPSDWNQTLRAAARRSPADRRAALAQRLGLPLVTELEQQDDQQPPDQPPPTEAV